MGEVTMIPATLSPAGQTRPLEDRKAYVFTGTTLVEFEVETARLVRPIQSEAVLFGAMSDPMIRVKSPIPLRISREGDTVAVFSPDLEEFGYGRTLSDALDDFAKTVRELYLSLSARQESLSDYLQGVLEKLQQFLEVRR
jgi:hypothetical protein